MISNLRKTILIQLVKARRLGLGVPISRIVRVFNFNSGLTYKFLRELESEGVVEKVSRGVWMLVDNAKARVLAEYVLMDANWRSRFCGYFSENVPDIYYYVPDLPTTWFGAVAYVLVIADSVLKGRINPPSEYKVVYTSLRGKKFKFNWDRKLPLGSWEQSIADFLSYDPYYPIEQFLVWYHGDYDLDDVARRATPYGLKRLSTFLSFMRMSVGKPIATSFDYISLFDEEIYERYVSEYFTWVFANGVDVRRNI